MNGSDERSEGAKLLDSVVPAWREALPPTISRTYFDGFLARNREALIPRFEALAAHQLPRPRAGQAAVKALVRRLNLMPQGVRVGSVRYHWPDIVSEGDELEITFRGDAPPGGGVPAMVLRAGPRHGDELDLRGELRDGDGLVVASFGWIVVNRRDLVILHETSLSRWFGVTTTPERKLAPSMLNALAMLRAEEDGRPDEMHPWDGVHATTKDALIARGLAIVLPNKLGGDAHFKTTAAGRARLAETSTYIAPPPRASPDPEEVRMGALLRAGYAKEEAQWADALERGIAFEASQGANPREANRIAVDNLAKDIHFYDGKPAAFRRTTVYPLKFSHEGLSELFAKLNETTLASSLFIAGQAYARTSMSIDEGGSVIITYRPASKPNPQPINLPNGARSVAFIPGDLIFTLTNKAKQVAFSIELRNHEGREIAASDWWQAEFASVVGIRGEKVEQLLGMVETETRHG